MKLKNIYIAAKVFKTIHNKQNLYEIYKKEISKHNLPTDEYQEAINKLCEILEV